MLIKSETNLVFSELCRSVMTVNSHVSFVAIIDQKGRVEESQGYDGMIEKLSNSRKEIFFMENALMHRMRKEFYDDLGEEKFVYLEMDRNGLLSFPLGDLLLLVHFLRSHVNTDILANNIVQIIQRYEKKLKN